MLYKRQTQGDGEWRGGGGKKETERGRENTLRQRFTDPQRDVVQDTEHAQPALGRPDDVWVTGLGEPSQSAGGIHQA